MKPPPSFSQTMSTLLGMLSLTHITTMSTSPTTNGKLTKLCTYLAASEKDVNASGPIIGNSRSFPNVMFSPVKRARQRLLQSANGKSARRR